MAEPESQAQSPKPISLEDLFGSEGATRLRSKAPAPASAAPAAPVSAAPTLASTAPAPAAPAPAAPAPTDAAPLAPEDAQGVSLESLFGEQAAQRLRTTQPSQPSQLPLPMGTKEPPKPPAAAQGGVPASKKNVSVPAYVRRHLDTNDAGEPILYLTQSPKGSGINVSKHKAKIRANFLKEERERWEKNGRAWSDISDDLKRSIRETAGRKADKLLNSWIDEQRGVSNLWIKGDPAYETDELVKASERSIVRRAFAPFEALVFPQTTEVITTGGDIGKTFQQLNDFEGALGWVSYLGRFAPSTLLYTSIAGGGWGTPKHIKELKAGKDAFSYTTDLGDWMTDLPEKMGIISKETSDNWWVNAIAGGAVTLPIILMEPDIATPIGMAIGTLSGGPAGTAGGFLASKGAKGLKALKPLRSINKAVGKATGFKEELVKGAERAATSANPEQVLFETANAVIKNSEKTTAGRVLKESVATHLSTVNINGIGLGEALAPPIDAIQKARKAAPGAIATIEKLGDISAIKGKKARKAAEKAFNKAIKGNEEEVFEYLQAKHIANKLISEELAANERFARGYSQFKPKMTTPQEVQAITTKLSKSYDDLADLQKQINKTGITDALAKKQSKLLEDIQKGHATWGRVNSQAALDIAAKRAAKAKEVAEKSSVQLLELAPKLRESASPEVLAKIDELVVEGKKSLEFFGRGKNFEKHRDGRILYDATLAAVEDMIISANSLKKNLGVKAKKYGVPELQENLSVLYGTERMDEVVEVFDKAFGRGVFREQFVNRLGSPALRAAVSGDALVKIDSNIYDELKSAVTTLVEEGVKKQKAELGIELGEQMIQTSDFITTMTNVLGINRAERWANRAMEIAKNFADPARKKFGSPIKAVIKSGRSLDSLIKRAYNETGEVFTGKIPRNEKFAATVEDIKENFQAQAAGFKNDLSLDGDGGFREYVAEVLRVLSKGKTLSPSKQKKIIEDFVRSPNERVYELVAEAFMRKERLKQLMTTTEAVSTHTGDTLTNIGKSSWWDLSKSWWRRGLKYKTSKTGKITKITESDPLADETLTAFVRSFLGQGARPDPKGKAVAAATKRLQKLLIENPEVGFDEAADAVRGTFRVVKVPVASGSARNLAHQAAALATASSQERALFDMLRRMGGVTDEVAKDVDNIFKGELRDVKDLREVFNVMERYGIPTSRDSWKNARGAVEAALQPMKVEGRNALIPEAMIKAGNENLAKLTKELDQYNPQDQLTGMLVNNISAIPRLWRASIITGLISPNPTHFVNILFGNFSQMWAEQGFGTATRITAQTLKDFVPYFGKKLDDMLVESQKKTGNNTTLGSVFNSILNPQVGAFFNRAVAKDSDKILGKGSRFAKTWGELREVAVREGVLSSYVGTDIKKAMTKRLVSRGRGGKFVDDFVKGERYQQFAEVVEQRQRVALFMDLVMRKGMDPKDAADSVKKALYDWDAPLGDIEAKYLNNIFLFWRFWKQSLGQAARHLTDPLRQPTDKPTDLVKYSLFQKSPLTRGITQARIAGAVPELTFDKMTHDIENKIEAGTATPEERTLYLQSMLYPWWKKEGSKIFLANYPIDSQASDQYMKIFGKKASHEAVTMPGLTVLDTYGMILGLLGGMSAATITGGRALAGSEDVDAVDTAGAFSDAIENPLRDLANPAVEAFILDVVFGKKFDYDEQYTKLKPAEKKLIRMLGAEGWLTRRTQGKNPDPEGVERLPSNIVNIFRLTPFLGTQLSRTFDPFVEGSEKAGYTEGLTHILRQLSGLGKTYPGNPESQIVSSLYKIKEEAGEEKQKAKYEYIEEEE